MNVFKKKKSISEEKVEFYKEFKREIIRRSFGLFVFIMICSGFKSGFILTVLVSFLVSGFLLLFDKVFDLIILGIKTLYIKYLKEWFDGIIRAKQKIQE